MLDIVNPPGTSPPVGPYSLAAVVAPGSRLVLIAGQVGADDQAELVPGGFDAQFERAMDNFGRVLAGLGATWSDVAYTRGHLTRQGDLSAYRALRERFYSALSTPPPTTTLVVAGLYHPECLFEIDGVAVIPA
jgi:enamine deaminase RidA (YjgF/YER057c/UK114 family)